MSSKRKITAKWKGGMKFESDNPSGINVLIDTQEKGSDKQFGLNPKGMMLSSLAGCTGIDIISLLDKMKVELDDFTMHVEGELTDEHPKYFHKVSVDYHFYGSDLKKKKIEKEVNLYKDKYCGVMEMFRHFAEIKTQIHLHES